MFFFIVLLFQLINIFFLYYLFILVNFYPSSPSKAVIQESTSSTGHQKPKSYSLNRRKVNPPVPEPLGLSTTSSVTVSKPGPSPQAPSASSASLSSSSSSAGRQPGLSRCQEQCLKEFLRQHVDMVFTKSVNDNVGRHGVEPIFEVNLSSVSVIKLFFTVYLK